jgi:hypothetical protein
LAWLIPNATSAAVVSTCMAGHTQSSPSGRGAARKAKTAKVHSDQSTGREGEGRKGGRVGGSEGGQQDAWQGNARRCR